MQPSNSETFAMIRILKPQSKAKKLIEKEIDEDSAASKKGTAKQPQTPQTPQTPRREVVAQAPPQVCIRISPAVGLLLMTAGSVWYKTTTTLHAILNP